MKEQSDASWLRNFAAGLAAGLSPRWEDRKRLEEIAGRLAVTYSSQKPTVPGWYWWRLSRGHEGKLTFVLPNRKSCRRRS